MRNTLFGSHGINLDLGLLLLRLIVGIGMAMHGWDKIFGVNDEGVQNLVGFSGFVGTFGFPGPPIFWAWAAAISELVGGILIALGFLTRIAVFFVAAVLIVAIWQVKWSNGWIGGFELDLLYFTTLIVVFLTGPGALSLDRVVFGERRPQRLYL